MALPQTIDEVISTLGEIITQEVTAESNLAFFPVLYKKVTERIKLGVERQEFDDNPRMERLDVIFANRYLEAYQLWKSGQTPTESWRIAFEAGSNAKLLIMQHLLLGINAHINLDLGIAVAETVGPGSDLSAIENDYNKINAILASMVDEVQNDIGRVSPVFKVLDWVAKGKEDQIASFSIDLAREGAWLFAQAYHISSDQPAAIVERDARIARIANGLVQTRSRILRWVIKAIRFFETKNVAKVVKALQGH